MKLLVTGGAGYVGSVVTHRLVEAGHDVTVVDDLSTGHADAVHPGATFHRLSVHDAADVLTASAGFEGVVHLAARTEVAESVVRPDLYWHTNVVGTLALVEAMRAAGVPRLVVSSTCSMYAGDGGPLTEQTPVRPQSPYAATKHAVDVMLAGFAPAFGLAVASLRYANAAGALGRLGERHAPESHLIPIVLQVAAGARPQLDLLGDDYPTPDGTCVRDYVHVDDLATAHLLALEAVRPGRHEVYNLGNGQGFSNLQVIEAVRAVTGHAVPVVRRPRRPGDAAASVASSAAAHRDLGWTPARPDLHDIVADAWAFAREAGTTAGGARA